MNERTEPGHGMERAICQARAKAASLLERLPEVGDLPGTMRWVRSMMEAVDRRGAGIDLVRIREVLQALGFVPNMHVPLKVAVNAKVRGEWMIGQFLATLPGVPSRYFRAFDEWIRNEGQGTA